MYSRSSVGLSLPAEVAILCAQIPDVPEAPVTSIDGLNVVVSWSTPYDGSTPITHYIVKIRQSDDFTFSQELSNCDGSDSTIVSTQSCSIPVSALRASPFYLSWGTMVYATVVAGNIVGDSLASAEGSGAVILTVPDSPVSI